MTVAIRRRDESRRDCRVGAPGCPTLSSPHLLPEGVTSEKQLSVHSPGGGRLLSEKVTPSSHSNDSNSHFEERHRSHSTSCGFFLGAQASRLLRKRPGWPRSQGARRRSRPAAAAVSPPNGQNENCWLALHFDAGHFRARLGVHRTCGIISHGSNPPGERGVQAHPILSTGMALRAVLFLPSRDRCDGHVDGHHSRSQTMSSGDGRPHGPLLAKKSWR